MAAILKYKVMEDEDGTISVVKLDKTSREERYQNNLLHRNKKRRRKESMREEENENSDIRISPMDSNRLRNKLSKSIDTEYEDDDDEEEEGEEEKLIKNILYMKYKSKHKRGNKTPKFKY